MRNLSKPMLIGGGVVVAAVVAFLAFGVFGVHTLFIDKEVDEANPFDLVAASDPAADDETDDTTVDPGAETEADPGTDPSTEGNGATDTDEAAATTEPAPADETTDQPEVITVTSGTFVDGDHPTSGSALTITDGSQTFLRFEGFETDNGPDLNVYLRSSENPDDYIDLGDLKGNIGDQNYELDDGIDLTRYDFVDIWCVRFGVSFGSSQLAAT